MSKLDDVLEHHGVKGMKWGERKISRADSKFERKSQAAGTTFKIYNKGVPEANKKIAAINDKPQYKDQDFTRDSPARQKYYNEVQKAFIDSLEDAAASLGTNASGTRKYGILEHPDGSWDVVTKEVKHAAGDETIPMDLVRDANGLITEVKLADELQHYGVKGMHWGVRRSEAQLHEPSSDFTKSREKKAIAKTSGTKALSNEELKLVIERMNLERQYSTLNPSPGKAAQKFLSDLLSGAGKQQATKIVNDQAAKQIAKVLSSK